MSSQAIFHLLSQYDSLHNLQYLYSLSHRMNTSSPMVSLIMCDHYLNLQNHLHQHEDSSCQWNHIDVQIFFRWELQEEGIIVFKPTPWPENKVDIFMKNVDAALLHRHSTKLYSDDILLAVLKCEKP